MSLTLIILAVFGFSLLSRHKKGTLNTCTLNDASLFRRLFIVPAVQIIITFVLLILMFLMNSEGGMSSYLMPILFFVAEVSIIVCSFVFIKKEKQNPWYYICATAIVSLLLSVLVADAFYSALEITWASVNRQLYGLPILLNSEQADENVKSGWRLGSFLFVVLFILEYYYARWICCYYRQPSPIETLRDMIKNNKSDLKNTTTKKHEKSDVEKLLELKKLLDDGIISQEEFDEQKKSLLNQ